MNAPMSVAEWQALPKPDRAIAWRNWSNAERTAMFEQFAATTPGFALPYPENYNDPADSPTAFRELAIATDNALALMSRTSTAEANYVKGPTAILITDWNQALNSGFYKAASTAQNSPSNYLNTGWHGITIRSNPSQIKQFAWPQQNLSTGILMHRSLIGSTWGPWARLHNYPQSWGTMDNFVTLQHMRADGVHASRFAMGMKKDESNSSATGLDEWRVQCYDNQGEFTWSAIKIPESGIVSMPRGHATTARALTEGTPVDASTAATVGAVVAIVRAMLAGVDPVLVEPQNDGSA